MAKRNNIEWTLPEAIEKRLGPETFGRQRAIYEENQLLMILLAPPSKESYERIYKVFLVDEKDEVFCNNKANGKEELQALMDAYSDSFEALEDQYDAAFSTSDYFNLIEDVLPKKRVSQYLYEAVEQSRRYKVDNSFLIHIRDQAFENMRSFQLLLQDIEVSLRRKLAEEGENQTLQTAEVARAQDRLNRLASFTFPLMAVSTIFGMNLQSGLESIPPHLFWTVLSSALLLGLLLQIWIVQGKITPPIMAKMMKKNAK